MLNIIADWQSSGVRGMKLTAISIIVEDKTHVLMWGGGGGEGREGVMWRDGLLEMFLSETNISNWFLCLPPPALGCL